MRIAIFGTGTVGRTLAEKLASLGHEVVLGTRAPTDTLARTETSPWGDPPFGAWAASRPAIRLLPFAAAARHGELLINATSGAGSLAALGAADPADLAGKILVDVANPLDVSRGFPPRLSVCNDDSLGEQIQRAFPTLRVVKALNTVTAALMVSPQALAQGAHTLFLCGDDPAAKARVEAWLREDFGWPDILDLGGIAMARGTEMYLPLWVRMFGALQTPMFSVRVVR